MDCGGKERKIRVFVIVSVDGGGEGGEFKKCGDGAVF